jgi:sodium/hydrogen antiporter
VISLMTAGLKIPPVNGWKLWKIPFRLIFIAMPLTMAGAYFLGTSVLGLSFASAMLLSAVLAPTDPVLAAEVQLAHPEKQKEEKNGNIPESEFALTAEAGLNDGFAFPFTFLAVMLIQAGSWEAFDFTAWILDKLLLKIFLGVLLGYLLSKGTTWFHKMLRNKFGINTNDGLLAFSLAIFVYTATELMHGYGFLGVFVASVTLRYSDSLREDYKEKMHSFVDELERLLLVIWIIIFGGSIWNGVLTISAWPGFAFALLLIFIIRPLSGMMSLVGHRLPVKEKLAISFFGIRGIGSLFYLSWAFVMIGNYDDKALLYSVLGVVIVSSIIIHGLTAPMVFRYMRRQRKEK